MKTQLFSDHPLRPPNWRYTVAVMYLSRDVQPKDRNEDEATIQLYQFFENLSEYADNVDGTIRRLMLKHPHQFIAFEIFSSADNRLRAILEARLLAGESTEQIAAKAGVREEAVKAYEQNFFDVTSRLDRSDFISAQILDATKSDDYHNMLRHIGYSAGADALDMILASPSGRSETQDPQRAMANCIEAKLLGAAFAAAHFSDPVDNQAIKKVLQQYAGSRAATSEDGASTQYEQNIKVFMDSLEWSIGSSDLSEEEEKWYTCAAELRADQMEKIARGETLENEEELLAIQAPGDREPEQS